jgi:external thioesterase TEII
MITDKKTGKKNLLIALPFAGGNSYSYNFLKPLLPPEIILETLEYPGRGKNSRSSLVNQMDILLENLFRQYLTLVNDVKPDKIFIYGHSIGAVIGVALLHFLNDRGVMGVMPEIAIFSGHGSPQHTIKRQLSNIPSDQLIAYFERIGSLSKELAANTELMEYILPVLRNDLALYENHESSYAQKLILPLVIINGNQDPIQKKAIDNWRHETTGSVEFHELEGHHFFMSQYPLAFSALITDLISTRIEQSSLTADLSINL